MPAAGQYTGAPTLAPCTKKAPGVDPPGLHFRSEPLDRANGLRARALRARLDLESHLLPALQPVEVTLGSTAVEEELLTVLGCDKAEATVRDQFLDGACRHFHLLSLELKAYSTGGPVREIGACA